MVRGVIRSSTLTVVFSFLCTARARYLHEAKGVKFCSLKGPAEHNRIWEFLVPILLGVCPSTSNRFQAPS